MSQHNVEIARAAIDAFNRGDLDAALEHAAPDIEYDWSRATGPVNGVFSLDQIRGVLGELTDVWESFRIEPHEYIEVGEDVVVPWTFHGAGRDGIEVRARTTWTFTIRDGAINRLCLYQEREEALKAAGVDVHSPD